MKKRLFKNLIRDNRGSAIVVVMVAAAFITVLGSILLYLSLVNLQMKTIDRSGKETFYDAEAVMNEVRADIQGVVSDAINEAYTDVLNVYNEYTDDSEREAEFQDLFYESLYAYEVGSGTLFDETGTAYDADKLTVLLGDVDGDVALSGSEHVNKAADGSYIKLEDITVEYTLDGYYTAVTSDIKIQTPEFKSVSAFVTQSAMPDFTIIADNGLRQRNYGELTVTGNVYAGNVIVKNSGNTLNIEDSAYFVSAGDIKVQLGADLIVDDASSVWTNGIILENASSFTTNGYTYVANDLNLSGAGAEAVLGGHYFGYGSSISNPDQSSSIIVNGLHTLLDMSGIDTLVLAGHSFVDYGNEQTSDNSSQHVLMGQSVAVKSDQLAYLVPDDCLSCSNPFSYTASDYTGGTNNEDFAEYVQLDESLAQYGIDDPLTDILYMRKQVGETNLVYFCFKFEDSELANTYFRDYFSEHSDSIENYLNVYCSHEGYDVAYDIADDAGYGLAGEVYDYTDEANEAGEIETVLSLVDATDVPASTLETIENSFDNLCLTLSRTDDGGETTAESPYEYYVDIKALEDFDKTGEYSHDGVVKAIVCDGNYDIGNIDDSVHIVIASGRVRVNSDFTGLIIAGGNVVLRANVTADSAAVADALQALITEDGDAYEFLDPEHLAPVGSSTTQSGSYGWDMNALVTYDNWTKNEV